MAKTVVYDTLNLEAAEVQVDLGTGQITLRARYNIAPSGGGTALVKEQDVSSLLSEPDRTFVLDLAGRLKAALEAQELA